MKIFQYITIILFALASVFFGCNSIAPPGIANHCDVSDTLHILQMERFNRFSDSMNENNNKALMAAVCHRPDSAMYYLGKSCAYLEMETKELHK